MQIAPSMHRPQFCLYMNDFGDIDSVFAQLDDPEEMAVVRFSSAYQLEDIDEDDPNLDVHLLYRTENLDDFAYKILGMWIERLAQEEQPVHIRPRLLIDFDVNTWQLKVAVHPEIEINPDPHTLDYLMTKTPDGHLRYKTINELLCVVFKVEAVVEV